MDRQTAFCECSALRKIHTRTRTAAGEKKVQQLMKLQRESIVMWISTKSPLGNGALLYLSIFVGVGASCKSCLCLDFELQDVLDHTHTVLVTDFHEDVEWVSCSHDCWSHISPRLEHSKCQCPCALGLRFSPIRSCLSVMLLKLLFLKLFVNLAFVLIGLRLFIFSPVSRVSSETRKAGLMRLNKGVICPLPHTQAHNWI